jgi:ribosomal protein S3AE
MAKSLTEEEMQTLKRILEVNWPDLTTYDESLVVKALNKVEDLAIDKGVEAVTVDRLVEIKMELKSELLKQLSKKAQPKIPFKKKQ